MRNILILTLNDLAMAFKNKTLYLILLVPLFVFIAMALVDGDDVAIQKLDIGLIADESYSPALIQSLDIADSRFSISWHPDEAHGERWLREKRGDGVLVPTGQVADGSALIVLTKASLQTVAIVEGISGLQSVMEGTSGDWVTEIRPLQESDLQRQMLPTWILMLVLLVGFIVLPTHVAEDKEKKLLLGLLQTPIHEAEWLFAKVAYGMILNLIAVLFLHLLTGFDFESGGGLTYLALLIAGGFCFCSFGVFVGFLCRTQASARTLGVIFYLPHLLPSALAEFSQSLHSVAPLIPSYQFYHPIKSILLEGGGVTYFPMQLLALVAVGLCTALLSFLLMKKRWLM